MGANLFHKNFVAGSNTPPLCGEEVHCLLACINPNGHLYPSLKERGCCVLNFPDAAVYERCRRSIDNNQWETDEITASGLTAEPAIRVNAPRIAECFLNIECEYLWEHPLCAGGAVTVALRAVHLCMDDAHYDDHALGRYGESGYLYNINSPRNPETGEASPEGLAVLEKEASGCQKSC